jgi:undecaprenyl diphosphate synthase
MELFFKSLQSYLQELNAQGVCLRFLGSKDGLSSELCEQMQLAEQLTEKNQRLNLNIALNYTGKWDILNAVKQCMINHLSPAELNESVFASYLSASSLPNPDLMIRTSGEKRISNFFLWQLAYTELFFTDVFWPDFNKKIFDEALSFYASRERRFGKTSQQLTN